MPYTYYSTDPEALLWQAEGPLIYRSWPSGATQCVHRWGMDSERKQRCELCGVPGVTDSQPSHAEAAAG